MSFMKLAVAVMIISTTLVSAQLTPDKTATNSGWVASLNSGCSINYYVELNSKLKEWKAVRRNVEKKLDSKEITHQEPTTEIENLDSLLVELGNKRRVSAPKFKEIKSKTDSIMNVSVAENAIEIIPASTETGIDESYINKPAWMRIDGDKDGLSLWFGGSADINSIALEYMILYFPNTNGFEAVVGPYYSFGDGLLDLLPMIGFQYDLAANETSYFLPQLYMYSSIKKMYLEFWNIYSMGTGSETGDEHLFYGRYITKYNLSESVNFGPQAELSIDLSKGISKRITSFIIGGVVGIPFGLEGSFDMFFGIDTKADSKKFNSRFTFIHQL